MRTGTVLFGINNIFTIDIGGAAVRCRIKGKTLKEAEGEHNPLAPGDRVVFEGDSRGAAEGLITGRLERKNAFTRWNRKKQRLQTIAANVDGVACVSSTAHPPFRPRFIDRVILEAERADIPVWIVLNKCDMEIFLDIEERIEDFERIGYPVFRCSAVTGYGMENLGLFVRGKTVVFLGQSGVGKSTLLNRLYPNLDLKTASVSRKYDRGAHTTVFSVLVPHEQGAIIDTPGIREMEPRGLDYAELAFLFREFREFNEHCALRNCKHLDEPGCAVRAAVVSGDIHRDRYESYRTILLSMEEARLNEYR